MTTEKKEKPVILGVDPGTVVTGFGIVAVEGKDYIPIDFGCIRPPARFKLSDRYLIIFESLEEIIDKHKPTALSVETQFMQKNAQSLMKLSMARGIAIVAAKKKGIPVFEYTPTKAKKAIVGNGSASKHQVQCMIQFLLKLTTLPQPFDASDALALAICHGHSLQGYSLGNEM